MTVAILLLTVALAMANGANDDPKGVATLGGTGVARYRTALGWGVVTTGAGAFLSLHFASGLTKLFATGIVTVRPTPAFALAVLAGASSWVLLATVARLPVSTTHALVGALVGAGMVLGHAAVNWSSLAPKVVAPLLFSVGVAYLASVALNLIPGHLPQCVCVDLPATSPVTLSTQPGGTLLFAGAPHLAPTVIVGTLDECRVHRSSARRLTVTVTTAHWLSAGAASLARGLNDTPKIVAIGAFALAPAGMSSGQVLSIVALAMALGGVIGGMRIAQRLGDDIVRMDDAAGCKANLTSAVLVGVGAARGLPISLTHVATGAIAGTAGARPSRLNRRTLRDFVLAWTGTPMVAGVIAATTFVVAR